MDDQQRKQFASRLALVRERSGMTKAAFARALQIGDTTLSNYLAAETLPGLLELRRACELTGTSIQWLVFGDGPQLTADIPTSAQRIDERKMFTILYALLEQAEQIGTQMEPLELGQLMIEFYERNEPAESVSVEEYRRKIEIMVASRPGSN